MAIRKFLFFTNKGADYSQEVGQASEGLWASKIDKDCTVAPPPRKYQWRYFLRAGGDQKWPNVAGLSMFQSLITLHRQQTALCVFSAKKMSQTTICKKKNDSHSFNSCSDNGILMCVQGTSTSHLYQKKII